VVAISSGAEDKQLWALSNPTAAGGFTALEVTIQHYDFKGGPEGSGTGTVTGARLLHVSHAGLRYAFYPPDGVERVVKEYNGSDGRRGRTPAEIAAEIQNRTNAGLMLEY
jgi:hypothetical protein